MYEEEIEARESKREARGRHIASLILLVLSAIITVVLFIFGSVFANASVNAENGWYKVGMLLISFGYIPAAGLAFILQSIGLIIQLTLKKNRSKIILILQLIVLVIFLAAIIMYISSLLVKNY